MSVFDPEPSHNGGLDRVAYIEQFLTANESAFSGSLTLTGGTLAKPQVMSGVPSFGPAAQDGTQLIVCDDTSKTGVIEWQCNLSGSGTATEMIHLTGGSAMTGSGGSGAAILAIGLNFGGVGLFINNYTTGVGLKITQRSTISNAAAWAFLVSQNSSVAPAMYLSWAVNNGQELATWSNDVIGGGSGSTKLVTWYRSKATLRDTNSGYVSAVDGTFVWQDKAIFLADTTGGVPLTVTGLNGQTADLTDWTVSGTGTVATMDKSGNFTAVTVAAKAAGAFLEIYDTSGTANQRRFRWKHSSGHLLIQKVTDASVATTILDYDQSGNVTYLDGANFVLGTTTGTKIGTVGGATGQKIGFYGATPVVQPLLATGAAHTVDDVITTLQTLGLVRQS